jgi:hypothetical protein
MHGGYGIGTVDGNICPVAEPAQHGQRHLLVDGVVLDQ